MNLALSTKNLSKSYPLKKKEADSLRGLFTSFIKKPKGLFVKDPGFWALKDLNLQIQKNEIIGLMGENGSGKSTLLKLLSKITYPTSGQINLFGKVASLLEVRAGFHPELSGKENIYLAGTILGMRKEKITEQYENILIFSELEKFIHLPVKKYSSGMFVKLGFSVIAHLDADILLIDEILSVADEAFCQKCLEKIKELSSQKTILLVSHNPKTIEKLCTRMIVLKQGRLIYDGSIQEGLDSCLQIFSGSL
jgi:lipopolysaccharide transport system ATP-binding protein